MLYNVSDIKSYGDVPILYDQFLPSLNVNMQFWESFEDGKDQRDYLGNAIFR